MVIAGIIAEYNPFHNGHAYQLQEVRRITGADYVIAAVSGDFVQRGTPAITDKYTRCRMALSCGTDLVIELPTIYATASAEDFASGAVRLLRECGITHLCFGAECSSLSNLQQIAALLTEEPAFYRQLLQTGLKEGLSFPVARCKALCACLTEGVFWHEKEASRENLPSPEELTAILQEPNNILAIEYLKAIRRHAPAIVPVLIPRVGAGYHSDAFTGVFSSATAIRRILSEGGTSSLLAQMLPPSVLPILEEAVTEGKLLSEDAISEALGYQLLSVFSGESFPPAASSATLQFYHRIASHLEEYRDFGSFCERIKPRNLTLTSVRRELLHLLLRISPEQLLASRLQLPYLRILGFTKDAASLVGLISRNTSLPVITKPAMAQQLFATLAEEEASFCRQCFATDLFASSLYNQMIRMQGGKAPFNDFSEPLVIL